MVAVTVVVDATVVEIMEDVVVAVVETVAADAAIAAAGITGDGAAPADGTGITGKRSVMDSAKAMRPDSGMDSVKDGTMTAAREVLVVREARGGQARGVDAVEQRDDFSIKNQQLTNF